MAKKRPSPGTLPLFPEAASPPSPYGERNRERIRRWASRGIFFGSSSWKYPGWQGLVYARPYPSKKAFDEECLAEYAELFPTVCADFALYDFPDERRVRSMRDHTGDGFRISLKATDRITVKRYPRIPRYGALAGQENPDFLNAALFEDAFLGPVRALGDRCGVIIFEFSTFFPSSGMTGERFVAALAEFLGRLPRDFGYAVEIRNSDFLTADYLAMLREQGVAHVLNNWTRMPPIIEQLRVAGVLTAPFSAARALLRPGRSYQEAVEMFQPYREIREENPELREGVVHAVRRCIAEGRTLYAYINNRAEGNSPRTIEGILDILDRYPVETL